MTLSDLYMQNAKPSSIGTLHYWYIFAFFINHSYKWGMPWHSWLGHCATSRKVMGLIPDFVIGIFHLNNPSGCSMALGLTQPLNRN